MPCCCLRAPRQRMRVRRAVRTSARSLRVTTGGAMGSGIRRYLGAWRSCTGPPNEKWRMKLGHTMTSCNELPRYDAIWHGYARTRCEEPRFAAAIAAALADARTVVNVGAGAGSHEPR